MVLVAEQRTEHGGRVVAGQAEPVDAAVAADKGGRMTIADQGVILDIERHDPILTVTVWI